MRTTAATLVACAALLAGCTGIPSEPSDSACPDAATTNAAFLAAEEHFEDLLGTLDEPFAMVIEGTVEGDIGTFTFAHNPDDQALRLTAPDTDVRVRGIFSSVSAEDTELYGRNHEPGTSYEAMRQLLTQDDDLGVSFADDLQPSDYTTTCAERGDAQVYEYSYDEADQNRTLTVTADAPHRALLLRQIDPPLQDDYRARISYDAPNIEVDDSLPRAPITWYLEASVSETNDRGGIYMEAEFIDGTEWAPFDELEFHLVGDDGTIYAAHDLEDGVFDLEDGDIFAYDDADDNQMLSTDDLILLDLGPGLDIRFYDTWADAYTL